MNVASEIAPTYFFMKEKLGLSSAGPSTSEVVGHEIAAVAVGAEPNEIEVAVHGPQRANEALHVRGRGAIRHVHAESADHSDHGIADTFVAHFHRCMIARTYANRAQFAIRRC
jgi:hypothetical protein